MTLSFVFVNKINFCTFINNIIRYVVVTVTSALNRLVGGNQFCAVYAMAAPTSVNKIDLSLGELFNNNPKTFFKALMCYWSIKP